MINRSLILGLGLILLASSTSNRTAVQAHKPEQTGPATMDSHYQTPLRPPIHEAISRHSLGQPGPVQIAATPPPVAIEEMLLETQPPGLNMQFIGGYWGWDIDSNSFQWISGFWRDMPPGRSWVPGYWIRIGNGWQRVTGYWVELARLYFIARRMEIMA